MLTYKLYTVVTAALLVCATQVQSQGNHFIGQNSGTPISQEEGRFLQFNNIVGVNFLKDSTQTYTVEDDNTLILDQSKHYYYNLQGLEQKFVVKKLKDNKWFNSTLVENQYNYNNLLSEKQSYNWDTSLEVWIPRYLHHFEYNHFDMQTEVLKKNWVEEEWQNAKKTTFSYSLERLLEVETLFSWVDENAAWLAESRTLLSYNANKAVESEVVQHWNDSTATWVNFLSREYAYNGDDLVISSTRSVWEEGQGWVKDSFLRLHYNEKGQLEDTQSSPVENNETTPAEHSEIANYSDDGYLGETIQRTWDEESGSWEIYQKQVHFWSEYYNGYLLKDENEIDCQFANPYILGLPWHCDNLKDDVMYSIEVFDVWGRSFYLGQISNNASFRLSGNIPPGLYNVIIQGGLDRHVEKVLIRN